MVKKTDILLLVTALFPVRAFACMVIYVGYGLTEDAGTMSARQGIRSARSHLRGQHLRAHRIANGSLWKLRRYSHRHRAVKTPLAQDAAPCAGIGQP